MTDTLRLDVWLWRARFFRTRTLAADHIRGRGARLTHNGQTRRIDKPATAITAGDVVTLVRGAHISAVEILDLGTRRGPAAEAQALYRLLEEDK
ncbi:MAG: RNA-binding S4 domain-containing protein [Hyphomonas sp.]|nr:RNA-binding S4 domain-containing protein [Hyphomonas sp.]